MFCPSCHNEMQNGDIVADCKGWLSFRPGGRKPGFWETLAGVGQLTAANSKGWAQLHIPADFCSRCKKMIIETDVTK